MLPLLLYRGKTEARGLVRLSVRRSHVAATGFFFFKRALGVENPAAVIDVCR